MGEGFFFCKQVVPYLHTISPHPSSNASISPGWVNAMPKPKGMPFSCKILSMCNSAFLVSHVPNHCQNMFRSAYKLLPYNRHGKLLSICNY